jgi:hypothetical protein
MVSPPSRVELNAAERKYTSFSLSGAMANRE